jgi:hypothetical protein
LAYMRLLPNLILSMRLEIHIGAEWKERKF